MVVNRPAAEADDARVLLGRVAGVEPAGPETSQDSLALASPENRASEPPAAPEPLSTSSAEESPRERFEAFRRWLDEQGPRFQVWANDCIFIGIQPPVLELEFPEGFRLSHVSVTERDAELLDGLRQFFPECTRIQLRHRGEDSTRLTHREERAKEAHEAQLALEDAVANHADIQTLIEHFDAAIRSVHSDHRAPMPPSLVRGESS